MNWVILRLLILLTLSFLAFAEDKRQVTVTCPQYQEAFGGSCFQFVGLQRTFFGSQAWCEQHGGHLAFIPDAETQYFLQKYLDPTKDVWFGLAPSASPNQQHFSTVEGPLSWLDGSHITFSNWVSSPKPGAACGHIQRDSGFQWKATRACNEKLHFICQFESGRSIVCAGGNVTLQCGSGQVLMIDGGFYGRRNIHYCRSTRSPSTTPTEHQCGWVDVVESLAARCHGRQVCLIAEVEPLVEPCPQLGSYLSLDYNCKDGTNVTYRIQRDETLLSGLSVHRGNVSQNITMIAEMLRHLGPGCHKLTLHASNMVTFPEVSTDLQMCVLEKVAGLQASALSEKHDCLDSPEITIGVSLERGAPVLLLLRLTGDNSSYSESREMNTRKEIFHIRHPVQGPVQVKLRAWNVFSALEVDVLPSCGKDSVVTPNGHDGYLFTFKKRPREKHIRVARSSNGITAMPSDSVPDKNQNVTLSLDNPPKEDVNKRFEWTCKNPCKCQGDSSGLTRVIEGRCLPDPFEFNKYHFNEIDKSKNEVLKTQSICITLAPATVTDTLSVLSTDFPCSNCQYCFKTHDGKHLRCSGNNEVKDVFLPLGDSSSNYKLIITATAKNCSFEASTTIMPQVLDYTVSSGSSVDGLKTAVDDLVAKLKKKGILSGETMGQIFSSVSSILNGESDQSKKADREKLREQMLNIMTDTMKENPASSLQEVQVVARGLSAVVQIGTELSSSAQEEASLLFANLSSSLLLMNVNKSEENTKEMYSSASTIVEGASNILDYSSNMLSLDINPFSWNERGNISGLIGALSLTTKDGSRIPVENLKKDIEMVPSKDPLPFKLYLGYMEYPTETNHVAMTEMPHQGTTQEERYTWLLDPTKLKGNTGEHYLVVRPIVGPGIKSINANLSITSINAECKFWDKSQLDWSNNGCRVGVQTTHLVTQCLCNHLTFFGSSFFVTPNLVDPSRTAELFATFADNPVVVCFVGSLFLAYVLVAVWARRKDIQDTAKVKVTVLEDNDPADEYHYLLSISTGHRRGASTSSQTTKDFSDGHLWYSVISRPPSSTFTRVQRVSCCFSLLLCTMLTSIMFYGIPKDPSEQTMDLGHFKFTWQQFMIGVQSSLIMFPVNILIVSIFRLTRPREASCCRHKKAKTDSLEQNSSSHAAITNENINVTLETVIKDITRIARSLSKSMKTNIPGTEFGPGQQVDISAVLSVVEDFIKQNKTSDTAQSVTQSSDNLAQPQLPDGSAGKHSASTVEGIQKKSNKTQYLYRQLCHIDKELILLGPSGFPTPQSYSQALQQVQGMKGILEDELFKFSCVNQDEPTQKKYTLKSL
ncbi:hypothetical protein L3Q82_004435 [Scortum barcoo]|uniref:Uncharacterized protein n=1 Tax=Scortum barcoo TaxID=214431 RepID=A0ACB8VK82_9TELE|nr:hypothetical protein L3Q82_004435 [Scortum barcoo]